jgi:uncharacterized protein
MLGYALALIMGLTLGALGGGGSILTVPIFTYVMGFEPKQAIAMSLPVVGVTSLTGSLGHWRAGNFDLRAALLFGIVAMIGARIGAELAAFIPGIIQLTLLGFVMIAAAFVMLHPADVEAPDRSAALQLSPVSLRYLIPAVGLGVGILTGLVGIGGGFLYVPALVLLGGIPMKKAIGTSLLVIAMSSASGSLGYLRQVDVPWPVVGWFSMVAIAGSLAGTRLVSRISQRSLRRAFAYFLFVMAAVILYRGRAVLANPLAALHQHRSAATH